MGAWLQRKIERGVAHRFVIDERFDAGGPGLDVEPAAWHRFFEPGRRGDRDTLDHNDGEEGGDGDNEQFLSRCPVRRGPHLAKPRHLLLHVLSGDVAESGLCMPRPLQLELWLTHLQRGYRQVQAFLDGRLGQAVWDGRYVQAFSDRPPVRAFSVPVRHLQAFSDGRHLHRRPSDRLRAPQACPCLSPRAPVGPWGEPSAARVREADARALS